MSFKSPPEILSDWLAQQAQGTRVAIAVDSDRFLLDANVLARPVVFDRDGRDWQLAVFRGDDLAFRLQFRKASTKGRTLVVLSRGAETAQPIDVSCVSDILAKDEVGEPLDLSITALFRRVAPKINFPVSELRRFRVELLACSDQVHEAAEKLIQKWGKPDSWGRGQVAAMVLLAQHPELNLTEIWPDQTTTAEFLTHIVRLLVGFPELRPQRDIVKSVINEAAREQVRDVLFWADAQPEEVAAYLVLRDFAGLAHLQNPSTQLAGLLLFSPELPLSKMELTAPQVIANLKKYPKVWAAVNQSAESFLTPRRAERILNLLPSAVNGFPDVSLLLRQASPAILKQQLISALGTFFDQPAAQSLAWVAPLEGHSLLMSDELQSDRARQCRAALNLLLRLRRIEDRLAKRTPTFEHADALLDWFTEQGQHLLELDLAHAYHDLQVCSEGEEELQAKGQEHLFGSLDELRPSSASLKGKILARLRHFDESLAVFVRNSPDKFGHGGRSTRGFLRSKIDVNQVQDGTLPGRVWLLLFDGMRFDTWERIIKPVLAEFFEIQDKPYFCVLPSFTGFARTSLFAGALPSEWKGFKGTYSDNEEQLFAVNMGLNAQQAQSKVRFVVEADTTKARAKLNFADKETRPLNVLIYPVSDDACHEFGGDLASFNNKIRADMVGNQSEGVRGILDDLLKRIGAQDTVVLSSDHGFVELLPGDSVEVSKAEAAKAGVTLESSVHWRYVESFPPAGMPEAVPVPVSGKQIWMALGRRWFSREGAKDTPRYTHGGLSMAEVVVPGVVLHRFTDKVARVELVEAPTVIAVDEDEVIELPVAVRNTGNSQADFELRVITNLGEEILAWRTHLAPATTDKNAATLVAKYSESSDREPDPNNTVTAVTMRLRHTDSKGEWRDAMDGLITIPVKVKPKPVKLGTAALKSFDDV
jgi:hypothetical protein